MIDTSQAITQFLRENFTPATLEEATHKLSSEDLLSLLFNVFPEGSIDTYDLYDILTTLNYKPVKQSFKKDKTSEISFVWCLK
jgi:hypothetical protein